MSSLSPLDKRQLEQLLNMSSGYVLDFKDATFGDFFVDTVKIDIHSEKYRAGGSSKANKLRQFWKIEPDHIVGKVILALVEYTEEIEPITTNFDLADQCKKIANRLLAGKVNLDSLKETAEVFDAKHLAEHIRRIEQSIDTDPSQAIGSSKELIETCCKMILAELGKPVTGSPDIPALTKQTLKELELVPEGVPESTRGSDVIRRLLQNLGTIGNNLAEFRGLYGTGHGKDGKAKGLTPRHARLAAGAAKTLVNFLFDTFQERKGNKI